MKGIVCLHGEQPEGEIDCRGALTVCCDGALRWAEKRARVDIKAGDFDSLGYIPQDALVYPSRKNYTDGEIALDHLLRRGCTEIELYGGGGGRDDHAYGNLSLLYAAFLRGARATMFTRYTAVYCAAGEIVWEKKRGITLSLAPVGESAHIMESEGLRYPLKDLTLCRASCRGLSNVVEAERARVFCDAGTLFVFEVREEAKW